MQIWLNDIVAAAKKYGRLFYQIHVFEMNIRITFRHFQSTSETILSTVTLIKAMHSLAVLRGHNRSRKERSA
jgi:hypothetical protein